MIKIYIIIVISFTIYTSQNNAAKILGLFPFPSKSHFHVFRPIMVELIKRGHDLTILSNFHLNERNAVYKEIIINPPYDYSKDVYEYFRVENELQLAKLDAIDFYEMCHLIGYGISDYALRNDRVQELIKNNELQFELIITQQHFHESFLMFAYKFQAPLISILPESFENYMTTMMGLIHPYGHVPLGYLPYTDRMTFFETISNAYQSLRIEYSRKFKHFPQQDELIQKYFSHLGENLPSVAELEKNVSLILINNYFPLDQPKPYVPAMIAIGGVHILPPQTPSVTVKKFLDEARNGAIYINLGTHMKFSEIDPKKLEAFFTVFSRLTERILIRWEGKTNVTNLPRNVLLKTRVQQIDVLAHPHVKVFITHGGLLSIQEAVYRAVPIIGIPIFSDQEQNIKRAIRDGYGVELQFSNITEVSLTWALQQLLHNVSYTLSIRKASQIFRDRPQNALDTAIYWINYIIRHKGAPHIKSSAINIPWYRLYLLDIVAFLFAIIIFILSAIIAIVYIICKIKNRKPQKIYYKLN